MSLEVVDAECGYSRGKPILKYVSFTVEEGEICCLLGPNGCGKSTLFKSILGLMPLLGGKVLYNGEDTSEWSVSHSASIFAYVAQSHVPPFPYLVKDVVMLGRVNDVGYMGKPRPSDYAIVEEAMVDMGIERYADQPYTQISGGELQLVMIARALAQQPKVLVLDEPTAALDYGNAIRVIEKCRSLSKRGIAVIMTTHSPDHAFMCKSNVVLLQKNAPVQFGPANEIITEENMRSAYGVRVKIIEFEQPDGSLMRLCSPVV